MSCSCNCNPCSCDECDASNEPLSSALDNFTTEFFGPLTKSCVNGKVVWGLPCDLSSGSPDFPRNAGEGLACYFLRLAQANLCSFIPEDTIIVEDACYPNFQEAYDAANAFQLSLGGESKVVMFVGPSSTEDIMGDLVLTDNFNRYISIWGCGRDVSFLGNIVGVNSQQGFRFFANVADVSIKSIHTRTTDTTGTFNGGNIRIVAFGVVKVYEINTSAPGGNKGGFAVVINNYLICGDIITSGQHGGGDVTLGRNGQGVNPDTNERSYGSMGAKAGKIDTRAFVDGAGGDVNLGFNVEVDMVDLRAMTTGTGGKLYARKGSRFSGPIFRGTHGPAEMQLDGCYVFDQLDNAGGNCNFKDTVFVTFSDNKHNIADLRTNGAFFFNCMFLTNGTGFPINSTAAHTIIPYNTLMDKAPSANVTASEGAFIVSANIRFLKT